MLRGPIEYVPPAAVEVMLRRQAIPLDENEGIYVRDIKTGKVGVQLWFKRSTWFKLSVDFILRGGHCRGDTSVSLVNVES